jgi:hypothetical protein
LRRGTARLASGQVSFALKLDSVLTLVLWRGRNGVIGCSLPRQNLLEFCSEWIRGDERLLPRSNSDRTSQGPPPVDPRPGFHALGRRPSRATRRDTTGIWTPQVTQRFRVLAIRLRLKPKGQSRPRENRSRSPVACGLSLPPRHPSGYSPPSTHRRNDECGDPDKNRVELREAGEAMADLLCIPPLPQGKNPWDMRVAGPPAGRSDPAGRRMRAVPD